MIKYIAAQFREEYHHLNLWYFAAFIFGIIAYFALPFEPSAKYVAMVFAASFTSLYLRRFGFIGVFISGLIIAFCFGIGVSKYRVLNLKTSTIDHSFTSVIEGKISNIKPITKGTQVLLTAPKILEKKVENFHSNIKLNLKDEYANALMVGDRIRIFAFLNPSPSSLIPGGYDFALYNYFSNVGATSYGLKEPEIIERKNIVGFGAYVQNLRHKIYHRLIEVLGKDRGNFAAALLLGEGKGLDSLVMQNMRYAGISHILCVSGLHLSLVAMLCFIATRFMLNLSNFIAFNFNIKLIAAIVSLIGSFLYLMLSGMQIAATRAFIMTAVFIWSVMIGRTPYPLRSIAIAAMIILIINPEYVLHPSFQLSFIAVLSLVTGYEFYMKNQWILGGSRGVFANIKLYLFSNIYSSLLAGLATMPLVIYHFYLSSNYSVLSNLIAVPLMSFFMMPLAILSIILMPFSLDYYALKALGFLIGIIINVAKYIVVLSGAIWYFGHVSGVSILLYMIGFFWLTLWQKSWRHFGFVLVFSSVILMMQSEKPDLIFDPNLNAIGIKNKDDNLEIKAKRMSQFTKNYWTNWFGQKDVIFAAEDITLSNHHLITNSGHSINILFDKMDCNADVVLNAKGRKRCDGKISLNRKDLKDKGTILVFCNQEACKISYDNSKRFKF
jgi:competence protein ComEC